MNDDTRNQAIGHRETVARQFLDSLARLVTLGVGDLPSEKADAVTHAVNNGVSDLTAHVQLTPAPSITVRIIDRETGRTVGELLAIHFREGGLQ